MTDFALHNRRKDGRQSYCKACFNLKQKSRYNNIPRVKQARVDIVRRHKYGLEPADYEALLTQQNGLCAICGALERLVVDHDHETGTVRGLLCAPCNKGIGHLRDDPNVLASALAYLLQSGEGSEASRTLMERASEPSGSP